MQLSSILVILFGAVSTFASPAPVRNGEFVIDIQLHQDSKSAGGRRGPGRVALTGNTTTLISRTAAHQSRTATPATLQYASSPTPYCGYGGSNAFEFRLVETISSLQELVSEEENGVPFLGCFFVIVNHPMSENR
ncbi:hypothetical protein BDD12DRAFT_807404 [Trichophaea hybrida]|nr:hypothetical protein BDD12DRAFT_807404 [Trichophaea hybrida]